MAEGLENGCQKHKVHQRASERRSSNPGATRVCLSSPGGSPVCVHSSRHTVCFGNTVEEMELESKLVSRS